MDTLEERIACIQRNIAAAAARGKRQTVRLLAVTKTVPPEVIARAVSSGLTLFGENRVQEALPKIERFPQAEWHLIGRLQTNKVKSVIGRFALIHSLDRWKLATALETRAEKLGQIVRVLVQVNIGREPQKGGVLPEDVPAFLREVARLSHLQVEGLMAIPPAVSHPEEARPYFRAMYQLFRSIDIPGIEMKTLSMGMSADYVMAVEEGANLVRVGSLLFGERS
ncbi:MAG: YggS family pyridoxal phosphate-dependent enzyme [Firmicutes bacterium]|jgi:pyridoxal phosphate enzyme (YggS family)|nr:YggS family pyridoxal phosphate-dependent enzyme [Bacillota bacterium]